MHVSLIVVISAGATQQHRSQVKSSLEYVARIRGISLGPVAQDKCGLNWTLTADLADKPHTGVAHQMSRHPRVDRVVATYVTETNVGVWRRGKRS